MTINPGGTSTGRLAASPSARLERLPRITGPHRVWLVILSVMYMCDLADIYGLSYAAPAMRKTWELSTTQVGALTSCTFLGMAIGAVVGGRLSDRFGRRRTMIIAALIFSLSSILSGLAPGFWVFAVLRFLTGAGLQAALGVVLVYVAEMFPKASRGRFLSVVVGMGSLGIPLIAVASRAIVPAGPETWRWIFVLGGIGLIPALLGLFLLPESVRWDESNGNAARAGRFVTRLEQQIIARTGAPLPDPGPAAVAAKQAATQLFTARYRRRTLVSCAAMALLILGFYGFNNWVPTLLVDRGFTMADALTVGTILSLAPVAGALAAVPITDRWERRWICMVLCLLAAAAMIVFAFTHNYAALVISGFVAAFVLLTNTVVLYAYLPEIFPTPLRGAGSGLANGAGRVAGIASGFVIAAIAGSFGFGGAFTATALFTALTGLVLGFFGENTHNRNLDEIGAPESSEVAKEPA
ncbi:MFS transporter [Sciscionella sediminilitoris]|uniref:MFS transporter n=1 Tax=Sciscionella sediminilitoris TaxID=1445613 RepID=UPI00068E6B2F|nr:MFS transporter [Sciscionella sp. SE31]